MVFHLSDLGPSCCEIQGFQAPSSNNDHDKMGYISMKKHYHPRTEEDCGDDLENTELARKKKAKKNISEAVAGSSSPENSCFVALVTASNLHDDALYLPKEFTSSYALERKCREIVLTDGGERSWTSDLRFNKSSDTFYISRGWRRFCDENSKKAGGVFLFELVGNGETPLLSFSPVESRGEKASKNRKGKNNRQERSSREMVRNKCLPNRRDSMLPVENRFVTLKLTHNCLRRSILCLPLSFTRENGLDKPGVITLLGKGGTKWEANLLRIASGGMRLGKGWRDFAEANGLKMDESFTLESIWENGTPMLSLFSTDLSSNRSKQGEYCPKASEKESVSTEPKRGNKNRKAKNNREERSSREMVRNKCLPNRRDSLSPTENRFVTLTITPSTECRLTLPAKFARENSMNKPGMIYLLGKDGAKWTANLVQERDGRMSLGKGWKDFVNANNLKSGESFTMELIREDATPMLKFVCTESSSSKANEKESVSTETGGRDSSPAIQHRFVTLTLTPEDVRDCQLILPSQFRKANGINKLGKVTLLGKNKTKWFGYLVSKNGIVALGSGWDDFCEANGVKTGESFTLEFIHEQDTNIVLKFCSNSGD